MATWFSLMVEMERRHQEVARAAEHRYQKRILSETGSRGGLTDDGGRQTADGNRFSLMQRRSGLLRRRYEITLAWLGRRLVSWGRWLQKRYRRLSETRPLGAEPMEFVSKQGVDSSGCAS